MPSHESVREMTRLQGAVDLRFLTGATVTRVYFDEHAAGLFLDLGSPGGIYDWRVEEPFEFQTADKVAKLDPENASSADSLLLTLGRLVEEAEVDTEGRVRFKLTGGIEIVCASNQAYEAWQLAGPGTFLIVCLPGGGLATWSTQ